MKSNDLTVGNIPKKLALLAFPIMGTSFLQMAYNLIDMIWIGRLGAPAVAAIGTSGYFMWFSFSLITLSKVGAEVKIAQSLGAKKAKEANNYASTSMMFAVAIGILYMLVLLLFRSGLVNFFNLGDLHVEGMAKDYLRIVAFSMPFSLLNQIISGIFNASGHSKIPFRANAVGLVINMILDPIMIFGLGMGVVGAALATTIAQVIVSLLFIKLLFGQTKPYEAYHIFAGFHLNKLRSMLKISAPVALQNGLFTIIAVFVARIVASHGTTAIAVQKVGTQIEAITYMTASGFGVALSAMIGQNMGALKYDRVRAGFKSAITIMGIFGILTSILLFIAAEPLFKLFINEEPAVSMGIIYLRIISFSQLFMCVEITLAGGFSGLGKSVPPAIISVVFNFLRIPFSFLLSTYTILGLNGIWWTISFSSVFKGTTLVIVLYIILYRMKKNREKELVEDVTC